MLHDAASMRDPLRPSRVYVECRVHLVSLSAVGGKRAGDRPPGSGRFGAPSLAAGALAFKEPAASSPGVFGDTEAGGRSSTLRRLARVAHSSSSAPSPRSTATSTHCASRGSSSVGATSPGLLVIILTPQIRAMPHDILTVIALLSAVTASASNLTAAIPRSASFARRGRRWTSSRPRSPRSPTTSHAARDRSSRPPRLMATSWKMAPTGAA